MLGDEVEIRPPSTQELEVRQRREDAGAELRRSRGSAVGGDVLEMGEYEAGLEPIEELARHAILVRDERAREVVVRVADDLQMLRREAIEEPAELALGLQDVADVCLEGEDHTALLGHGEKGLERIVEQPPRLLARVPRRVGPLAACAHGSGLRCDDVGAERRSDLQASSNVLDVLASDHRIRRHQVPITAEPGNGDTPLPGSLVPTRPAPRPRDTRPRAAP